MDQLKLRLTQDSAELLQGARYRHIDNGGTILGVAHCDSVRDGSYHFLHWGDKVFSSALDDRLGVHVLLDILPALGIRCDVLLTDDEEIGQSTAQEFTTDKRYNWMFQFDRRGCDAVTYQFKAMDSHARRYFKLGQGSFSDICWLEHLDCAGLNIGTAYYREHTRQSWADLTALAKQICAFERMARDLSEVHITGAERERVTFKRWQSQSLWQDDCLTFDHSERTTRQGDCGISCEDWSYLGQLARELGYCGADDFMARNSLTGYPMAAIIEAEVMLAELDDNAYRAAQDQHDAWIRDCDSALDSAIELA